MAITGMTQGNTQITVSTPEATATITAVDTLAYYRASQSDDPQTDTLAWMKNQIIGVIGRENVSPGELHIEFDPNSGVCTVFSRINPSED